MVPTERKYPTCGDCQERYSCKLPHHPEQTECGWNPSAFVPRRYELPVATRDGQLDGGFYLVQVSYN